MDEPMASVIQIATSGDEDNLSSSETEEYQTPKKMKTSECDSLEERLNGILCCAVCLDLPKSSVYQCRNGHLMCSECFNHLLADAQLRMNSAVCPSCRTLISRDLCVRNLIVEKAVSELPITCRECSEKFPRCMKEIHEEELCVKRISFCCYYRIGCPWIGPFNKKNDHEKRCLQPKKEGSQIKCVIPDEYTCSKQGELNRLCSLLSAERIAYNDLQLMGPYHTDEYFIRYETFRFCAFDVEWEVRAHVNDNEADPTMSSERKLSYQLLLKEPLRKSIIVYYTVLKGPFGEMRIRPKIERFTFSDNTPESHFSELLLDDSIECYRLLSGTIRFRLIMFWSESNV